LCRIVATAGVSLAVFFTGLLLVYIFYLKLGWSPRRSAGSMPSPPAARYHRLSN